MTKSIMRFCGAMAVALAASLPALGQTADPVSPPAPGGPGAAPAKSLSVGDAAPALAGLTWLKAGPIAAYEPGRHYIVEFWATWCGPCRKSIPHLTELQARHKDRVTVIGISAWEREQDAAARIAVPRAFIEKQGAAMEYSIAADAEGLAARDWMQASGRRSIPTAFIVDAKGNVAWIGNPLSGMDEVLDKVMAGGFDARAEAEKAALLAAAKKVKDELFSRANLLAGQDKPEEGLVLIEQLLSIEPDPQARVPIFRQKLRMLLKADEPAAYVFARSLLEGELAENAYGLYLLAEAILKMPGLAAPDHAVTIALAARAAEKALPPNDAAAYETLGAAKSRAGDFDGAIAAAERALEILRAPEAAPKVSVVKRVEEQLREYRKTKGG